LFSRTVDDTEVITGQELRLAGLTAVQHLRCYEILEISIIGQDSDRGLGSFEFRTPFFKAADDSKQFLIVDLIVTLDGGVLLRKEGDRT
jgi:hypothetical protein